MVVTIKKINKIVNKSRKTHKHSKKGQTHTIKWFEIKKARWALPNPTKRKEA